LTEKFRPKVQYLKLNKTILKTFGGKIEILSIHNQLCQKFAALRRKNATSCTA